MGRGALLISSAILYLYPGCLFGHAQKIKLILNLTQISADEQNYFIRFQVIMVQTLIGYFTIVVNYVHKGVSVVVMLFTSWLTLQHITYKFAHGEESLS